MSTFLEELDEQLLRAAERQLRAPERRLGPNWVRTGLRVAPLVASVAVVAVISVGALLLLGHRPGTGQPSPSPPSTSPHSPLGYVMEAERDARAYSECGGQLTQATTFYTPGMPSAGLRALLGVLRRPAVAADRPPAGNVPGDVEIYRAAVRRAQISDGVSYWLEPAKTSVPLTLAHACGLQQVQALQRLLPSIPARLRAPTRALQMRRLQSGRNPLILQDVICLISEGRRSGFTSCHDSAADIRDGLNLDSNGNLVMGIVPDGVASVTASYPAAGARPAVTVTRRVIGNLVVLPVASADSRTAGPSRVTWRSARGRILKRFVP